MKVAVVGSRDLSVDLSRFIPPEVEEIVSGGARGIDQCARQYARFHDLKLTEFLPDYRQYQQRAPLLRNLEIIAYCDCMVAVWDGASSGTYFTISRAILAHKKVMLYVLKERNDQLQETSNVIADFLEYGFSPPLRWTSDEWELHLEPIEEPSYADDVRAMLENNK